MAGISAFKEAYLRSDTMQTDHFSDFEARKLRYQIYWAFYENNAYRDLHTWAKAFRADYGLYRYIRNIYNPAYRIGEFWRSHLLAGPLDPEAGDGEQIPSSLPIVTDNEALRIAIANTWRSSNWAFLKDTLSLWGSILGDAFIQINDDPIRQKVYMTLRHPGTIKDVTFDDWHNIKGYVIEEVWANQDGFGKPQIYTEKATRYMDSVLYETYLDNKPFLSGYDENGTPSYSWLVPYGFIPMVAIQHNNVGLDFGWSEIHPAIPKIREVDDVTSKLNDQIRKMVDAPWFLSGVKKGDQEAVETKSQGGTTDNPESGRQKIPTFYGPTGSSVTPMVADLDIGATSEHINTLLKDIEKDYPELTLDLRQSSGEISGRALRIHRQPVEDKVEMRRVNYDDAIIKAQQMAVAIGGWRGYKGYEGFNLDSYAKGDLDHRIGKRPVFKQDPLDDLEAETELYKAASEAKKAGISLPIFLKRQGWTNDQIQEVIDSEDYQAHLSGFNSVINFNNNDPNALAKKRDLDRKKQGIERGK